MREACVIVFDKEQLKYALNTRLMPGAIKKYDRNVDTERDLYKAMKNIEKIDLFGKLGKSLIARLGPVISAVSSLVGEVDSAKKITNYVDYRFAIVLALRWSREFGTVPTFVHPPKIESQRILDPSPFQSFVSSLPLRNQIKQEILRTAVETIQELQGF
jgi:hypothetical protein